MNTKINKIIDPSDKENQPECWLVDEPRILRKVSTTRYTLADLESAKPHLQLLKRKISRPRLLEKVPLLARCNNRNTS